MAWAIRSYLGKITRIGNGYVKRNSTFIVLKVCQRAQGLLGRRYIDHMVIKMEGTHIVITPSRNAHHVSTQLYIHAIIHIADPVVMSMFNGITSICSTK